MKKKREKKILFSETIDRAINGYALGISFLGIGLFLLLKPNYFFAPIVSYIIGSIIGFIGVCGTGIELSKSSNIKGMDNLAIGLVVSIIWIVIYTKISAIWSNIVFFPLLIIGAYAVCLGLIQGVYSIINNIKMNSRKDKEARSKGSIASQIVLFLTQLCALIVAIINVVKATSIL